MVDEFEFAALKAQVAEQGKLIERLYAKVGLGALDAHNGTTVDGQWPDVVEAVRAGNKIDAIKRHRAHTGAGLKESKDAIDALASSLGF